MDIINALNSRYSVRAFKPDPVDKETIQKILEAATRAPSWANTQPWEIIVAGGEVLEGLRQAFLASFKAGVPRNPDLPAPKQWPTVIQKRIEESSAARQEALKAELADADIRQIMTESNYRFFGAPVVIYLCMDRTLTAWSIFDIGMLAQSIMLAAEEYGLGSIPAFNLVAYPDLIRQELGISENLLILIGLALGYGDSQNPLNKFRIGRQPIQEVVTFRGF